MALCLFVIPGRDEVANPKSLAPQSLDSGFDAGASPPGMTVWRPRELRFKHLYETIV